jgi:hypothetical protein
METRQPLKGHPMLRDVMITGAKQILRRLGLEVHRATNHNPIMHHFDWQDAVDGTAAPPDTNSNPLREFFDSRKQGPGIWKWNHYFDIYDRHFRRFRGQEVSWL